MEEDEGDDADVTKELEAKVDDAKADVKTAETAVKVAEKEVKET